MEGFLDPDSLSKNLYGAGRNFSYTPVVCYPATRVISNGIWVGDELLSSFLPIYLLQCGLAILVSRCTQLLLKPLNQPAIVSDILGGVIMGPSVLGKLGKLNSIVFPDHGVFNLKTSSVMGVTYYMFTIGVKMDVSLIGRRRKPMIIALSGMLLSIAAGLTVFLPLKKYTVNYMAQGAFTFTLISSLSTSAFPVIFPFLREFRLLNSELGRIALYTSMVNDVIVWISLVFLQSLRTSGEFNLQNLFYHASLTLAVVVFGILIIRPMTLWIIRRTPEGSNVNHGYIVTILLGVMIMALATDSIGLSYIEGPLILGLVIPDGPPLGAALAEKIEMIMRVMLLPLFFANAGQKVDLFAVTDWVGMGVLILTIFVSRVAKLLGTIVSAIGCRMGFHDAFLLGLVLSVKGIVEMISYGHWALYKLADDQTVSILTMSVVVITGFVSPLVKMFSANSRKYRAYARRTIQHNKPNTELRLLTCVHDQDSVPAILSLLETTHATTETPICVYAMHLTELAGHATPSLIAHKQTKRTSSSSSSATNAIFGAFRNYERHYSGHVSVQPFTCIAPYETMHNDVCYVALDKKVSLIIVPFHKKQSVDGGMALVDRAFQIMNPNILREAPCSVGILVDRGSTAGKYAWANPGFAAYNVGVIFIGGPDDREALSYASLMTDHSNVTLTVWRFLSKDTRTENIRERRLDDDLVAQFRVKSVGNERITCRDDVVEDGEELVNVMRSMKDDVLTFHLMVVGRRQVTNMGLVGGLSIWNENPELGVLGDLCSSDLFGGTVSVLAMQQQVMSEKTIDDFLEDHIRSGESVRNGTNMFSSRRM